VKRLSDDELQKRLFEVIRHRTVLDDSKYGRIIEKVHCESMVVLIKYVDDAGLAREVQVYEKITPFRIQWTASH